MQPSISALTFPADLYYHIEHQVWLRLLAHQTTSDTPHVLAEIGITALGIALSGDIYMCRPKKVGSLLQQGGSIAVVELAKSIVSVKSPASGCVVAINPALEEQPEIVHRDPYGMGWLVQLQLSNWPDDSAQLLHQPDAVQSAMQHHAWLHRHELLPQSLSPQT